MDITACIIAGGKSSRFKKDKRFIKYKGESFLSFLISKFKDVDELIISTDNLLEGIKYKCVVDERKDIGPIEGIYRSLKESKNEYVFMLSVDMPNIDIYLASFLSSYITNEIDIVVPVLNGQIYPLPAIYKKSISSIILKEIEAKNYRLMDLLKSVRTKYVDLKYTIFDEKYMLNVNTKEDYFSLIKPLVFAVSGLKKSGKTTLIENLIPLFNKDGFSVAVIKHDGHSFEFDKENTDTYRFYKKGVKETLIFSSNHYGLNAKGDIDEKKLINFTTSDVVIIEGLKDSAYPKIYLGKDSSKSNVIMQLEDDVDIEKVYERILSYFLN